MAAADLLVLIAVVIGLAVAAELLGDRLGVPNFLFFILAGILIGPVGIGLVHHEVFGEGLAVVVGLGVAIILFHSGTGITRETLTDAPSAVFALGTVGIVVTFLGASLVAYLMLNVALGIALLIGALLVATGTTVIEPLLATIPIREDLEATLEIEATITEVTAGVLSIAVFHAITRGEPQPRELGYEFVVVLVVGVGVGGAIAAAVWFLFEKPEHAPKKAPKHATQLYLATAVVTYAVAESITKEAGVAAAATAGILLGNADLPYQEHITQFKDDITTFVIAFIFVILASFAEPDWLTTVGLEGLLVAGIVIVVVRPLAVFLSTAGSVLSTQEKLFLSTASPRGIIPAGVATLIALSIQEQTPTAAAYLTGTVLLVIIGSSIVEGVFAGRVAERFGLTVDTTVIVGGGRLGLSLADQYAERGERVTLVETDQETLERAREAGFAVYHGDGTEEDVLRKAKIQRASRVVAATDDDDANLAIARLVRSEFDVESVLVQVNERNNRAAFEQLDVELLTGSQLDLWALRHLVDQSTPDWLEALTRTGGINSVPVPDGVETTVARLEESLPNRAFIVALSRDGQTWVPDGTDPVEADDRVTLLGRSDAVEEGTSRLVSGVDQGLTDVPPSDVDD